MSYQDREFATSVSSWTEFRGRTVGELVSFFEQYPPDLRLELPRGQLLMARRRGPDLLVNQVQAAETGGIPTDQLNASNDG